MNRSGSLGGAARDNEGQGRFVMPFCDIPAMQAHLLEVSAMVASDAHADLILDEAGWHLVSALVVLENITLLSLPARSPELNAVNREELFGRREPACSLPLSLPRTTASWGGKNG